MNTNDSNKNTDRLREMFLASLTAKTNERYTRSAISVANNDVSSFSSCVLSLAREFSMHKMTEAFADAHRWGHVPPTADDLAKQANTEIHYLIKKLEEMKTDNLRIAAESVKQELPEWCGKR